MKILSIFVSYLGMKITILLLSSFTYSPSVFANNQFSDCLLNLYPNEKEISFERINLNGERIQNISNIQNTKKLLKKLKTQTEVTNDFIEVFDLLNLTYKKTLVEGKTAFLLTGKPTDNETYTKLISSIRKKLGTKIYVSNTLAKELEGSAYFQPAFNRIVIPDDFLYELNTSPHFYHELRHSYQESLIIKGKDSLFFGDIQGNRNKVISNYTKEYDNYMSIDELSSFSYDIRMTSSLLNSKLKNAENTTYEVDLLKFSSNSLLGILKQTLYTLNESKRIILNFKSKVEFEVIDKKSTGFKIINAHIKHKDFTFVLPFNSQSTVNKLIQYLKQQKYDEISKILLNKIDLLISLSDDLQIPVENILAIASKPTITNEEKLELVKRSKAPRSIVQKFEHIYRQGNP